jgi:hypothetical protein
MARWHPGPWLKSDAQYMATHPRLFSSPLSHGDALANLDALMQLPHCRVIGELDGFWVRDPLVWGDPALGSTSAFAIAGRRGAHRRLSRRTFLRTLDHFL